MARDSLLELGLNRDHISIVDQSSNQRTVNTPAAHGSFWAHIKEMFMPDEDRSTLEESVRRGGFVVIATADDARADEVIARLERAGAVNLNEREEQWRAGGWKGEASPTASERSNIPCGRSFTGSHRFSRVCHNRKLCVGASDRQPRGRGYDPGY